MAERQISPGTATASCIGQQRLPASRASGVIRHALSRLMIVALSATTALIAVWSPAAGHAEDGAASFSDGSTVPMHRVFTYRQDDGVPAFTDRAPANQTYEVMEFACYACNPFSRVDWHSTPLHPDLYADLITSAARTYGVEEALVRAVIHAESGFNPNARSRAGAFGLMQLMPGTASDLGVNPGAIRENVDGGVRYLASLLRQYRGDVRLATAAYNAGPASVDRYGGVPPFDETVVYVDRVRILRDRYKNQG